MVAAKCPAAESADRGRGLDTIYRERQDGAESVPDIVENPQGQSHSSDG